MPLAHADTLCNAPGDGGLEPGRPGIKTKEHTTSKLIVVRVRSNMLRRRMNVAKAASDRVTFKQRSSPGSIEKHIDRLHGRLGGLCRGETDHGTLAQRRGTARRHVIPEFLHRLEEKCTT